MTKKRNVNYEFRPSKRDVLSIAYDLGCEPEDMTDEDIREWITQVLCEELCEIRRERTGGEG